VFDAVLVEERDPILTTDSGSFQRLSHLAGSLVQLRPRLVTISQDQSGFVGESRSVRSNDAGNGVD
jgi:hypothetical protein